MNGEGEGRSLRLAEFAGSVPEWLRLGQWSQQTREEVLTLHDYSEHQFVFFFFFRLSNKADNTVLLNRVVVRIKYGCLECTWLSA